MRHFVLALFVAGGISSAQTVPLSDVIRDINAAQKEVFVQMPVISQGDIAEVLHGHTSDKRLLLGDVTVRGLISPAAATHPEDYTGSLVRNGATFKFATLKTPIIVIDATVMYRGPGLQDGISAIERIDNSSLPAEQRNRSADVFNRAQVYEPEWAQP